MKGGHLLLGSGNLRKVKPFQIDENMQVDSFSGSKTSETIRVMNQYPEQKLDVVVLKQRHKCGTETLKEGM